ncbi:MAG: alkaline phosphatase family protein [Acidobacteriaceae bacterium]
MHLAKNRLLLLFIAVCLMIGGMSGCRGAGLLPAMPPVPTTASLSVAPPKIVPGDTATLTWSTTDATTVSIDQGIGVVSPSGSTTVSPTNTTRYTLTATGSGGGTATATATVTVQMPGSANSPIAHLIILMMQNHSLDNLFGTYPGANGLDAALPSYRQVDAAGHTVSPTPITTLSVADLNHNHSTYAASWDNGKMDKFAFTNGDLSMQYYDASLSGLTTDNKQYGIGTIWSYAQQYALADNFFMSAMNTEPAQELYMIAATVDSNTTSSALPFYDPCSAVEQQQSGGTIAAPLTETNVGDQLTAKQVSWAYAEINFVNSQNGTCTDYVPQEEPFQYFTSTENSEHTQNFTLAGFNSMLADGSLPSVYWIQPDGLKDMHPGGGNILDGIEFLDEIVQAVKGSSEWQSTAIIVLWDESGGWYDHVPPPQLSGNTLGPGAQGFGMRVPVLIISPYAKTNYISHQQMDFVSILRFIQWNWNLGEIPAAAQQAREQQSGDLCDLLTSPCGPPSQ